MAPHSERNPFVTLRKITEGRSVPMDFLAGARPKVWLSDRLPAQCTHGVVSKNEFIDFMLERFDRLDVNGDRRLEPVELRALRIPNWRVPPKEINRDKAER